MNAKPWFKWPDWVTLLDSHPSEARNALTPQIKKWQGIIGGLSLAVMICEFLILYQVSRGIMMFGPQKSWDFFKTLFFQAGIAYIAFAAASFCLMQVAFYGRELIRLKVQEGVLDFILKGRALWQSTDELKKQTHLVLQEIPFMSLSLLQISEQCVRGVFYLIIAGVLTLFIDPVFFGLIMTFLAARAFIESGIRKQKSEHFNTGIRLQQQKLSLGQSIMESLNFLKLNQLTGMFLTEWQSSLNQIQRNEIHKFNFNRKIRAVTMGLEILFKGGIILYVGRQLVVNTDQPYLVVFMMMLLPKLQQGMAQLLEAKQLAAYDTQRNQSLYQMLYAYKKIPDHEVTEKITDGKPGEPVFISLVLQDVTYSWNHERLLLRNLTFRVHKGEKVLITGENGSGKSTLFALLLNLLKPSEGDIYLETPSGEKRDLSLLGAHSGVLFQNSVYPDTGVREWENALKRLPDIETYIPAMKEQSMDQLSFGERRKLSLLQLAAMKKEWYILDEPDMGLDDKGKALLIDQFMNHDKTLVIFSPQNTFDLKFDRVITLE